MHSFSFQSQFKTTKAKLFDWHKKTFALERLTPPWESIKVKERIYEGNNFIDGGRIRLQHELIPLIKLNWNLIHKNYSEGNHFTDYMIKGPFKYWEHQHIFEDSGDSCSLIDDIKFDFFTSNKMIAEKIKYKLHKSFHYRHKILKRDIEDENRNQFHEKLVLITGGDGMIGSHLIPMLNSMGYGIVQLKFSDNLCETKHHDFYKISWNPYKDHLPILPKEISEKIKFGVNLSGENILGLYTENKKNKIRESRIISTNSLKIFLEKNNISLESMIHASATGYYGNNMNTNLDESTPKGSGFLSDTTEEWEYYQNHFSSLSNRVINLRIGAVLSIKGGFLKNIYRPYMFGLGIGIDSNNYVSHISIEDLVRAICFIMKNDKLSGVINAVSPNPIKMSDIFNDLNNVLKPLINFKISERLVGKFIGEIGKSLALSNQNIIPKKLLNNNFIFLNNLFIKSLKNEFGQD